MVFAKKDFKEGQLRLVAASTRVDKKSVPDAAGLGSYKLTPSSIDQHLYLMHQVSPPMNKDAEPSRNPFVSPFWLVRHVDRQANLTLQYGVVNVLGTDVHVP